MISNSGHDERGKYSGGTAGDQTGTEWQIIPWYSRPWTHVLRYPSSTVRECIASLAEEAANNNLIGYDQAQRTTFWGQLKQVGYHPKAIKQPCEADCSAGVAAIVKAAGYLLNMKALQNVSADMYTGNERAALKNAGFQVLTDKKYLDSDKELQRGDILLCEGHHTCVNLTDGKAMGWHWVFAGGKWYYQDGEGFNAHGWRDINESAGNYAHRYYFDSRGEMVTGLQTIQGKLFYFHEDKDNYEGALCSADSEQALGVWCLPKA